MKIYQLHKFGGEWEDSYDYIIGSYLRKERAEEEKLKAEQEERELVKRSEKCNSCPFLNHPFDSLNDLLSKYSYYCDKADLEGDDYGMDCSNYYSLWDVSYFEIKEVEVEE